MFKKLSILVFTLITFAAFSFDSNINASDDFTVTNDPSIVLDRPFMDGTVVFDSNMNGNWDIYAMDGQGNNLRQITFSVSDERWPSISPDGSHIAFTSNEDGDYNIVIQDLNGDRRFNLTHNGANETQPDWGPWDQILYVSDVNGNKDIFIKNIWGTPEEQGFGQSDGVQMTYDAQDDTEPAFAGEGYGNIFGFMRGPKGSSQIWAKKTEDDFREWPVREGGNNTSPSFHPYDAIYAARDIQPQFLFLNNGSLSWSNTGWNNDDLTHVEGNKEVYCFL